MMLNLHFLYARITIRGRTLDEDLFLSCCAEHLQDTIKIVAVAPTDPRERETLSLSLSLRAYYFLARMPLAARSNFFFFLLPPLRA
jgi:hypothetical protein